MGDTDEEREACCCCLIQEDWEEWKVRRTCAATVALDWYVVLLLFFCNIVRQVELRLALLHLLRARNAMVMNQMLVVRNLTRLGLEIDFYESMIQKGNDIYTIMLIGQQ